MNYQKAAAGLCIIGLVAGCTPAGKELPEPPDAVIDNQTAAAESTAVFQHSSSMSYETVAKRKYGDGVEFFFNDSRSHVICVNGGTRIKSPFPTFSSRLEFFVYDVNAGQIVFEETLDNARVSWEKDTLVRVSVTPGIVQVEASREYGYLYDLVAREKRPLGN